MYLDALTALSIGQTVRVSAASTNVYDTAGTGVGQAPGEIFGVQSTVYGRDIGGGGPLVGAPQLIALVGTAFSAGGPATLQFQLQAAIDNGSYEPGSWDIINETDAIPVADLLAGSMPAAFTVPQGYLGQGFPRFYQLYYNVGSGPMTGGTIAFAGFLTGIDDAIRQIYPSGF